MKKGWKIFWVMCISLGVLGIALCISGIILGATAEKIREVFGIQARFTVSSESGEFYEGGSERAASSESGEGYESRSDSAASYGSSETQADEGEQFFSDIEELKVDVTCLEVDIFEGDGGQIRVYSGDLEQEILDDLTISKKDKELEIEMKGKKKWENLGNRSRGVLSIQIPAGQQFKEVSVKVGAGLLTADDLHAEEMDIDVGAGQVYLNSFYARELDLECGAGEAELYGEIERETKIECGVGRVSFTAVGSREDYDYKVSCGIGSVTVGEDSYSGLGGERKISNGGSKKMEIECGIGEVEVSFDG